MFARALKAFARKSKPRRRPVVEGMEPRVLFSADGLSSLLLPAQGDGGTMEAALERIIDLAPVIPIIPPADSEPLPAESSLRHELVVVDSRVADYESLVESIRQRGADAANIEIVVLKQSDSAISRIGELLEQRHGISAVHILSHGREGAVQLGAEWLDVQALRQQASVLAQWQHALTANADILIYGCDVAQGGGGQFFIEELARLTGADIAASTNLTGSAFAGGDWDLELRTGLIETSVALDAAVPWVGLLDYSTGLIGNWRFDANANDFSGNNYNGTLTNGAVIDTSAATNKIGGGKVSLDGVNDYVDLSAHLASFSGLAQGTIAAWVKTTSNGAIFDAADIADGNSYVSLWITSGDLNFEVSENNVVLLSVQSTVNVNNDAWRHVAVTVDATGNKLYIDGAQAAVTYNTGTAATKSFFNSVTGQDGLWIGTDFNKSGQRDVFKGLIDDVRVYDRPLTSTDINLLFTGTPVITSNGGGASASVSVAENTTSVTTVIATDVDTPTLTYSLSGGADKALFNISPTTGALSFASAPNFEVPGDAGGNNVYDVTVQVSDGTNTDTQAIAVTVTNVNEAPSATNDALASVAEDSGLRIISIASLVANDSRGPANESGQTLTITAVSNVTGGTAVINGANIEFTPTLNYNGAAGFDYTLSDNGTTNGVNDFKTATGNASFTITEVNDAPSATNDALASVAEDSGLRIISIASLVANDSRGPANESGQTLTITAVSNVTGGTAVINGANIEFTPTLNYNGAAGFDYTLSDNGTTNGVNDFKTATGNASFTITAVNDAPVITSNGGGALASINIAENSTAVTTVVSTDVEVPGQTLTYSIAGVDAAKFNINPTTGALTFIAAPNFEAPTDTGADNVYDVTVQVSDGVGGNDSQDLRVIVGDLRVTPQGQTSGSTTANSLTLSHTSAGSDRLMLVTVSMANPNGNTVTGITYNGDALTLVGTRAFSAGVANEARIEIWSLVAPDVGTANVVVSYTSPNPAGSVVGVTTYTGVDQAIPLGAFVSGGGDSVAPTVNVASGPDELVFAGISVESGINYNLVPGTGQTELWDLHLGSANGGASSEPGAALVTMDWTFGASNQWAVGAVAIKPTLGKNFAPVITSNGGGSDASIGIAENSTGVTTVAATDADLPPQTVVYGIAGGDDAVLFAIDPNTGVLTFVGAPNFENPLDADGDNGYEVIVSASDGAGGIDTQQLTVTVTNVNEAPVNTVPGAQTVNEDTALAFSGANAISINDVDIGAGIATTQVTVSKGTLNVTLSGAASISAGFNNSNNLTLTGNQTDLNNTLASLKYTGNLDYNGADSLKIITNDQGNSGSGGALIDTDTIGITVTAVNDAPAGADKTVTTLEDTAYTFTAADFGYTDPIDAANTSGANALANVKISSLPTVGALTNNGITVNANDSVSVADINAGKLKFTPVADANKAGYASFTFQVQDNGGVANGGIDLDPTANTITIDVTAVNDAPAGADKTVTTLEDTAYTFTAADFGYTDPIDAANTSGANALANVKISSLPTVGALTNNGITVNANDSVSVADINAGKLKFTPVADANKAGYASFTFQVQDNGGVANGGIDLDPTANTITIDVTAVNDAPAGADKTVTTLEDTAYTFTAADFGYTDPIDAANTSGANALANVKISSLPTVGALTNNGITVNANDSVSVADINAGKLKFTPVADANKAGYASFTFQVQDNGGVANGGIDLDPTANTITIDVTAVNDAPAGADKTVTTLEDTAYTFTAADFGYTDPIDAANTSGANALANVKISSLPTVGALTNNGITVNANDSVSVADINAGKLKFTPVADANKAGYASFTFQVQDNGGVANGGIDLDPTANTITIDVTAVNDAPAGADKTVTTLEDTAYTFTAADFGYTDPIDAANTSGANALANVKISSLPTVGALTNNGITVNANDSVSVADINAGKLKFTPVADANKAGYASFTFQVQDNGGVANGGIDLDPTANTITIDVTAVNDAPAGADKTVTTLEDTAYTFTAADFGYTDPIDAANTSGANALANVKISSLPTVGALTNNGITVNANDSVSVADINAGKLKFTPVADANKAGYASFTFQVQDNGGVANGGIDLDPTANTITIDVTAVNDAPAGADKTVTTLEDTAYTFTAADFGYTDPIDAANTSGANALANVKISSLPTVGALTNNGITVNANDSVSVADINAGKLKFTPVADANKAGYASFTFQVQDNGGVANGGIDLDPTANTITIDVTAVNDAPAGADKTVTTLEDTAYTFTAADFGYTDPIDAANTSGANALANVKISSLPTVGALTNNGITVNANDSVSVADINAGKLKFTPVADANKAGYASFTFQVQDNGGVANGGIDLDPTANTITIDVTAVNDAPAGADKTVTTLEDTAYTFTAADFGYTDPIDAANTSGANALANVKISSLPTVGALTNNGITVNANDSVSVADINAGKLKFTPVADANKAGYASFTFQVQDNGGVANGGIDLDPTANTITIDVTAVNDAPAGADKTVTTLEDTAYTFTAADFGYTDPIDAANTSGANALANVKISSLPTVGALTNNGITVNANDSVSVADINAGKLKFTPVADANKAGYASFTFQVQDNGGVANGGIDLDPTANTITIDVTAVNDPALISGTTSGAVIEAGGVANGTPNTPVASGTLTDTDVDNPANTFTAVAAGTVSTGGSGTFEMTAAGVWTYTVDNTNAAVQALNAGQQLTDTFTVQTVDGTTQLITLTINGRNDNALISGTTSGAVIEAGGVANGTTNTPVASGTLTDTDVDNPANTFTAVAAGTVSTGGFGSYEMTAAGVWTYTVDNTNPAVQALNAGQQLTDTFTVQTVDGTTQLITLTINGRNDNAVISGTTSGAVIEAGGVANGTPNTPVASGTLTDTDVDNPNNLFTVQNAVATTYGSFQIGASGRWTYNLNNNDSVVEALNVGGSLIDTFVVATQDGTAQAVTITIGGTNDNAVITNISTGVITEAGGVSGTAPAVSALTGVLLAADKDNPSNVFRPVIAGIAHFGTFDLKVNGAWVYTLDNTNPAVEALGNGGKLTDQFTVASVDGTTQVVVINIQGTLDIKPGGGNPGPAITLGAELVDSTVNEVRNFESRGNTTSQSTAQDNSGGRGRLKVDPVSAINDAFGSVDADDGRQRTNARGQRGVLTGAGGGFQSRLGLASRLGDYSLDFGAYDFGDYRFQMGRISFAQQMTGRGLGISGGEASGTSNAGGGGEEQVMSAAVATKVAGLSLTLGVAAWALRSGGVLAAMLSSLPAWRQMDLLPIFSASDQNKPGMGNTDTESTREERAVDRILGGGAGSRAGGAAHGVPGED